MVDADLEPYGMAVQNIQNGDVSDTLIQCGSMRDVHVHKSVVEVGGYKKPEVWFGVHLKLKKSGRLVAYLKWRNSTQFPVYNATVVPVYLPYRELYLQEYISVIEPTTVPRRPRKLHEVSWRLSNDLRELKKGRVKFERRQARDPKPWLPSLPDDEEFVRSLRGHLSGVFAQYWQGGCKWIQEPNGNIFRSTLELDDEWEYFKKRRAGEFKGRSVNFASVYRRACQQESSEAPKSHGRSR